LVGLQAWILSLQDRDDEADRAADESRALGAADDAVTQILWRAAKSVVLARRGEAVDADRIATECVDIADATDSMDVGTAWLARAQVLVMLGRHPEAKDAARRSKEAYARKGWASGLRRAEALLDA
jgi:hypothetical protein